ncbi:MAG: hypothetical protein WBX11_08910 [Thiobacillaceae bacterium]
MADTIKVLAIPSSGWNYGGEQADFVDRIRACNPSGYYVINGFSDAADLAQRIQSIINGLPNYPALEQLEIWCHAHSGKIDGITVLNVATWSQALKGISSWSDEASIYLSGCNSGLTGRSVAQALANAMPFQVGQFEHHIHVYGAAGYLYGNHACGDARTECTYIRRGERRWRMLRFVWGFVYSFGSLHQAALEAMTVDVEFKPYPGCRNASGAGAYNEFRNWS